MTLPDSHLSLFSIYEDGDRYTLVDDRDEERCWALTLAVRDSRPGECLDLEMVHDSVAWLWRGLVIWK